MPTNVGRVGEASEQGTQGLLTPPVLDDLLDLVLHLLEGPPDPRLVLPDDEPSLAEAELAEIRTAEYRRESGFHDEVDAAKEIHAALGGQIGEMMRDLREGKNLDFDAVQDGQIVEVDAGKGVIRIP